MKSNSSIAEPIGPDTPRLRLKDLIARCCPNCGGNEEVLRVAVSLTHTSAHAYRFGAGEVVLDRSRNFETSTMRILCTACGWVRCVESGATVEKLKRRWRSLPVQPKEK